MKSLSCRISTLIFQHKNHKKSEFAEVDGHVKREAGAAPSHCVGTSMLSLREMAQLSAFCLWMAACIFLSQQRLILFLHAWHGGVICSTYNGCCKCPEKERTCTCARRHRNADCAHKQDSGNHHCASQWATRGTQRAEHSVFMCVCVYPIVNRDNRHTPCHLLSPLSSFVPLFCSSRTFHLSSFKPLFVAPLPLSCVSSPPPCLPFLV